MAKKCPKYGQNGHQGHKSWRKWTKIPDILDILDKRKWTTNPGHPGQKFMDIMDKKYYIYIYNMVVGSRSQVFNGTADKTSGGLMKKDLFKDANGRIRSKKASQAAKKRIATKGHAFKKYIDEAKKRKGKSFKKMQKIVKSTTKKQTGKGYGKKSCKSM